MTIVIIYNVCHQLWFNVSLMFIFIFIELPFKLMSKLIRIKKPNL